MENIRDKFAIVKTTGMLTCLVYISIQKYVLLISENITDLSIYTDNELIEIEKEFLNNQGGNVYSAYKALEISTIVDNNNQGGNVYSEKTLNEVREKANEILTK